MASRVFEARWPRIALRGSRERRMRTLRYTAWHSGVARTRAPADRSTGPPSADPPGRSAKSVFDTLSERLRKTLASLTGRGRVSEADVDAAMREVRLALLEADVNYKVVKDFVARVRERAIGADDPREPQRRPAGHQDRPRGADRAPRRRRPDLPPDRLARPWSPWSASRARARRRPRPSSPATSSARAAGRCSSPPTPTGRPPSTSWWRWAAASTSPSTPAPLGTPVVEIARGGVAEARRKRPRHGHPRHRRPPDHRRHR